MRRDQTATMPGAGSVLVIDDEPVLQDVLRTLLEGNGFDYHPATDRRRGLRVLREEEVDVVLLDLMLPDRNGLELLPEIKAHDPHLPVVVITAYSSIESAIDAMRQGAFHYVPKPFKNEEVLHLVRRAAERRRLQVGEPAAAQPPRGHGRDRRHQSPDRRRCSS